MARVAASRITYAGHRGVKMTAALFKIQEGGASRVLESGRLSSHPKNVVRPGKTI